MEWKFEKDDVYKKRMKCKLTFEIPKGAYATVVVDRVME